MGRIPSTPFEGLFTPFEVLEDVCLIWEVSRAHEVSHDDWKTQVGALFVSGLDLHPTTINRAHPLHFSLLIHKRVESTHTLV